MTQHDTSTEETTGRERPEERFAAPEHLLDLPAAIRALRDEATPIRDGHREITLYHKRPVTLMLFAFEKGGGLESHKAAGLVTIHALEGALTIRTEEQKYNLSPGMVVVLAPNVQHSVHATQKSAMLLTVCMHPEA